MKGLKAAIKAAEKKSEDIERLGKLANGIHSQSAMIISNGNGYRFDEFTQNEISQIVELLAQFVNQRIDAAGPMQEKLNTLSSLIEDKA